MRGGYGRRALLRLGTVAAAGALVGADAARAAGGSPEWVRLLGVLRRRWFEVTTGVTAGLGADLEAEPYRSGLARMGAEAARHRDGMAAGVGGLWEDLALPSYNAVPLRLLGMARAYALPGTGVTGDPALGAAVAEGIDRYRRLVYAAGAEPVGNWWHWQIGVPLRLLDAALLVETHLGEARRRGLLEAVDHFVPESVVGAYSGTSTGANRVDLCTVLLLRAMLAADQAGAARAVSALSPVFGYVRDGDGFYRDGSFIQHTTVPYQGTYGVALLTGLARLLVVLRGTPWEIDDVRRRFVFGLVERAFAPVVHDGFCMDMVAGRAVGRRAYGDHARGRRIAAAILLLAESAPAAERIRWQGMVKGWALRDVSVPMVRAAEREDLGFHARLAAVLRDEGVAAVGEPYGHRLMAMSARAVHRRPGWCAGLSMASDRVGHYEHGNGENRRGWHTGSGMLYWWGVGHGDQYSDGFWSTVDPYRLPGTTVSTKRLSDGAGGEWGETCPPARWVGGATDGEYAAVGQHLYGLASTLEAFKSWFFLDDAIVCLGAGIRCADGVPVETIVDNRRTDARLVVDEAAGWAHLAGHGGYVLPGRPPLRTLRERRAEGSRKGTRRRVASSGKTHDYVTLWLDHGVDPRDSGYFYVLMPGADPDQTRARAAAPSWVEVVANTAHRQGIRVPSLGLTAVNFWLPGSAAGLTASGPCSVLVRAHADGTATISVADPRRDLRELTVVWDRPVARVLRRDPRLSAVAVGVRLGLTFTGLTFTGLGDAEGASARVTVRLG
ncbi:polysaccharide lyase 8 family protein [Thermopolyspora sp. NPDC052614]|uniref:polysaccharide lyase 8 family protein n=1 Tax=Thermopolyspora sp. NPDC052614 TaxID=3155682 RepID=UPI003448F132